MENQEIITNMINNVYNSKPVDAQTDFEALMMQKINDAIEDKKQKLAQTIYTDK